MKNKILELRKSGKSMKYIAKELNCARSTVSYHCNNAGLGGKVDRKILIHDEIIKIKRIIFLFFLLNNIMVSFNQFCFCHVFNLKNFLLSS